MLAKQNRYYALFLIVLSLCISLSVSKYIKCENGGYALSKEGCEYVQGNVTINCPKTKPYLCPDFECVESESKCSSYVPLCPPHKPYKCWDNECRTSFEECPTPVTCPSDFPKLCQNGMCVKDGEDCKEIKTGDCPFYRCFDGTCATSIELCPTHVSCGKDNVKCWDGACVTDISQCRPLNTLEACPSSFPYRCLDGSCRTEFKACSTISVCPPHLPVKCFDNSCRASTSECPDIKPCVDSKLITCPDGTCASKYSECPTRVTCTSDKPFLCADQTCKMQLDDCPDPTKCKKTEVLCPEGECMSNIQYCKTIEPCEKENPIRCEMNTCTDKYNQCSIKNRRCPIGSVQCDNGECKISERYCQKFECPKNKPYYCKEGVCVHDKELCDDQDTGCPYNAKFKCPDGTCVNDETKCIANYTCSREDYQLCPDGSCVDKEEECPLRNGCYRDRPFKCADGSCVNPDTTTCVPVLCPYSFPYRCPNGNCVQKSSDCSNDLFSDDLTDCGEGMIMCVDGRCVTSSDYCRPNFDCETGYKKCPDGSCRVSLNLCPQNVQCPESRPYRCSNQLCVKSEVECTHGIICPTGYSKCINNGLCMESQEYCEQSTVAQSGCSITGYVKCPSGRCVKELDDCSYVSPACPDDSAPYLCGGTCSSTKCEPSSSTCSGGKTQCESGKCATQGQEATECTNNIGCPLNKPYRCSNGECVESSRKCNVTTISQYGQLISNVYCDSSKPFQCYDKTCVSDPSFCKTAIGCPKGQTQCYNGFCAASSADCKNFEGYCPPAIPVSCPSGTCVDELVKCPSPFNVPSCGEGEFYCARLNKCLTKKLDCLIYLDSYIEKGEKKSEEPSTRRLIENLVDPLSDKDFINTHRKVISMVEEEPTPSDKKTNSLGGAICYDGTIASGDEQCPIVPPCKMGQYRCENGGCASTLEACGTDSDYVCVEGQKKCPDGMCHKDCKEVSFHGCEVGKYQCSNGLCVEDRYECIGHSMCEDTSTPYRCITGECKPTLEACEAINRLGSVKNLTYSFNKNNKVDFAFAFDPRGRTIGRIQLPGNSLSVEEGDYSKLYIEEVSSSILSRPNLYNNTAEFLFNVSNTIKASEGILTYENSVMTPAFKFYAGKGNPKKISFRLAGKINIAHNEYEEDSRFLTSDYCLAKLRGYDLETDTIPEGNDQGWECVERQTVDYQTEFQIKEFGVYAVIINPFRNKINYLGDTIEKNFFLENIKYILIVIAIIILVLALIFYIFFRVTRYRQKYHENRTKIQLLQQQKQEYENMTTDIFGQTLGDNINGIVYKANPAYTTGDDVKRSGTSLEEEIEKLQIECRNVSDQNERLQKDISDITEQYKTLTSSIENMNK